MNKTDELVKHYFLNYYTKEEVGYRLPPEIKLDECWPSIVAFRKQKSEALPFTDQQGEPFWFVLTPELLQTLHLIDSQGKDSLYSVVRAEIQRELMEEALVEEALFSSAIEGAFSTLARARALIVEGKRPRDHSEQMIANNARVMRYALEQSHTPCSTELIHTFQRMVTDKTLDDPEAIGRFRNEVVYIYQSNGRLIYTAPPVDTVEPSIAALVDWINAAATRPFLHPIIAAIIIHTYFVYVHPYVDGNGRTARSLLYWYLLKHGYEFFRYFSISSAIQETRAQYYKALKDMEDYGADMTYVLRYLTRAIERAIALVCRRITDRYRRDVLFAAVRERQIVLNARQTAFLKTLSSGRDRQGTMAKYQRDNHVVYETARRDLSGLEKAGIVLKRKIGRQFVYMMHPGFLTAFVSPSSP